MAVVLPLFGDDGCIAGFAGENVMRSMLVTLCAVTTAVLTACGSDNGTAPTPTPVADNSFVIGTWNLTTVDGVALPYIVQAEDPLVEIVSDRLVLLADGTFTELLRFRVTDGGAILTQSRPDAGRYSFKGSVATFTFNDQTGGTGTVLGESLTVAGTGTPFVYTRE
jgi:hypothetical protein